MTCFARLDLGADTAIDSSRRGKQSTLVGDDMAAAEQCPAAAVTGGTLSLARPRGSGGMMMKTKKAEIKLAGRRMTDDGRTKSERGRPTHAQSEERKEEEQSMIE